MKISSIYLLGLVASMAIGCSGSEDENLVDREEDTGSEESLIEVESEMVFHRHYASDLTDEQASELWAEDVAEFDENHSVPKSTSSFRYYMGTYTSRVPNAATDGDVYGTTFWRYGNTEIFSGAVLNNAGDDREGGWDYYLIYVDNWGSTSQVSIKRAWIALEGTDGWYLDAVRVTASAYGQPVSATGSTSFWEVFDPPLLLDSPTSSGNDYYWSYNYDNGGYSASETGWLYF